MLNTAAVFSTSHHIIFFLLVVGIIRGTFHKFYTAAYKKSSQSIIVGTYSLQHYHNVEKLKGTQYSLKYDLLAGILG